jgi:hypothetical protein
LAGYGKPDPADLDTLKRFAPPKISNRNAVTTESIARATNSKGLILVVDSPKQILDVLKLQKAA